jgi:hypothetical protein
MGPKNLKSDLAIYSSSLKVMEERALRVEELLKTQGCEIMCLKDDLDVATSKMYAT